MTNLSGIVTQLGKERDRLHQQLSGLDAALEAFAGVYRGNNGIQPRRTISAKGRAKIAAAQRARWARVKGQNNVIPIAKAETNNVSIGSSQNRSSTTSEMGQGQEGEESGLRDTKPGIQSAPLSLIHRS